MVFQPWQFPVGPPSGADDTPAINAAVTRAITYAQNNAGSYAEIIFNQGVYTLSSPTTKTATNQGNAQIPLPVVANSSPKITLAFRGVRDSTAPPLFGQTVIQKSGTVLLSTLTGLAVDGTFGLPSVIGGPTPQQTSTFSNIMPVIDGIQVICPLNPTLAAFDFRLCACAKVLNSSSLVNAVVGTISSTTPTSSWATGLFMPQELSNDASYIGDFGCYGYYYGAALYAHASAHTIKVLNCGYGIFCGGNGNDKHGLSVGYASAEQCGTALQCDGNSGVTIPVHFGLLDVESVNWFAGFGGNHIQDANNGLGGRINLHDNSGGPSVFSISGGANCEIIAANQGRGHATSPGIPASTTPLTNPFWRNAMVVVHTGAGVTVSAIAVDGTATAQTVAAASSSVPVLVPAGKTITLTYAGGTPTWDWWLS